MSSSGAKDGGAPGEPGQPSGPSDAEIVRSDSNRPGSDRPGADQPDAGVPARSPVPPKREIPRRILEHARVVQGARRPDDLPPAPPPSGMRALPKLPKPSSLPKPASQPPPVPPPARGPAAEPAAAAEEIDALDVAIEPEPPPEAPRAKPRRSPMQMPAICGYGRFEILGRIAFGGMAEIFLGREATSVGATRLLAIKRILPHVADDPQFVEMFLDEARLAIQLNHPQICHIYEFGELEGSYFIAMEWIHGAQLGKLIRKARGQGGIAPELAARIVAYVAEALHYAHRARDANGEPLGIVHRDVSPHNIMVSYDGQVKLLDFGIAKAQSHTTKTEAGIVKGKFSYMSPQQCLGKPIDARADVFALGICLYETLTGEPLYHRDTEYETMRAVIEDPVPSIRDLKPGLPIELDAIVQKALQKDPDDRFRSAGEMQSAIEDWLAGTGRAITTARIGELMEKLFEEQIQAGPLVDSTPFGASFRRRPGAAPIAGSASSESGARTVARAPAETSDAAIASPAPSASASMPSTAPASPGASRARTGLYAAGAALTAIALVALGAVAGGALDPAPAPAPSPAAIAPTPPVAAPPPPEPEPIEARPPAPTTGSLRVELEPGTRDATVRIGEHTIPADALETAVELLPGNHLVHVERDGYRPWDREIEVHAGEEVTLEVALVPLPRTPVTPPGRLSINTRPWSKVYVGARLLGTTPIGEASVPSGAVRLRIVDRDGRTFTRTVRVPAGGDESVFYDLDE